jgi:hypothetical protein
VPVNTSPLIFKFILFLVVSIPAELLVGAMIRRFGLDNLKARGLLMVGVLAFVIFVLQNQPQMIDDMVRNLGLEAAAQEETIVPDQTYQNPGGSQSYGAQPESDASVQTPGCPNNGLSPRMQIGHTGRVMLYPDEYNFLRTSPGFSSGLVSRIAPGHTFDVLDGPVCADNINWWYVRSSDNGKEGWTSEGEDGQYYIEPY